jgi:hypothetical protein
VPVDLLYQVDIYLRWRTQTERGIEPHIEPLLQGAHVVGLEGGWDVAGHRLVCVMHQNIQLDHR